MKTVESVCKELRSLDAVVGAFVVQNSRCLGSSLPPQYDAARLTQVGSAIANINRMSQKSGYENCAMAFHWLRASLMTWPIGQDAMLGLLAAPAAVFETVQLSASVAVEDLKDVFKGQLSGRPTSGPTLELAVDDADSALDAKAIEDRLGEIERLLKEELGPSGKSLLDRCRSKTTRGSSNSAEWLLRLRAGILQEIADPGVRAVIAMSHFWADSD